MRKAVIKIIDNISPYLPPTNILLLFQKKSFTLLELFLALTIILVSVGISFPYLRKGIQNLRFKNFVNKVYLFLDYNLTQAVLKNQSVTVKFDSEKKIIYPESEENLQRFSTIQIPTDLQFRIESDGKMIEKIEFFPDGTTILFKITITDNYGREKIILSEGINGKIQITEER